MSQLRSYLRTSQKLLRNMNSRRADSDLVGQQYGKFLEDTAALQNNCDEVLRCHPDLPSDASLSAQYSEVERFQERRAPQGWNTSFVIDMDVSVDGSNVSYCRTTFRLSNVSRPFREITEGTVFALMIDKSAQEIGFHMNERVNGKAYHFLVMGSYGALTIEQEPPRTFEQKMLEKIPTYPSREVIVQVDYEHGQQRFAATAYTNGAVLIDTLEPWLTKYHALQWIDRTHPLGRVAHISVDLRDGNEPLTLLDNDQLDWHHLEQALQACQRNSSRRRSPKVR